MVCTEKLRRMANTSVEYIFGCPSSHYDLAFEPCLYNQEAFLRLKDYSLQSFYAINRQQKRAEARVHFTTRKQVDSVIRAISLPELPFGSLEYGAHITSEQLSDLLNFVYENLTKDKVTSLEIRDCAPVYRCDTADLLPQLLQSQGFTVKEQKVNHHIPVDAKPFLEKIHAMQKRRLRKCVRAGFTFRAEPLTKLVSVYKFIQQCRAERGWSLSLSLEQLAGLVEKFPERYHLFSVVDQNQRMAAATVVVQVNKNILYNFYPASPIRYSSFSPLVYLIYQLYDFASHRQFRYIDLGISTTESLKNFKSRMGGVLSYKKTYLLQW